MTAWWSGLTPAETTVACGGVSHRIRWERGAVRALDHADIEGERTMAVLGGERCGCVEVLDAWARFDSDPLVLTLASRAPTDQVLVDPALAPWAPREAQHTGAGAYVSLSRMHREDMPRDDGPAPLLSLGGGLADRFVATVAHNCAELEDTGGRLQAALYGRVTGTLRAWLAQPELAVELELTESGSAGLLRREDATVHAALPFAWVPEVWARGLAIVAGRFVLSATADEAGTHWELETVGPDLGTPGTMILQLPS